MPPAATRQLPGFKSGNPSLKLLAMLAHSKWSCAGVCLGLWLVRELLSARFNPWFVEHDKHQPMLNDPRLAVSLRRSLVKRSERVQKTDCRPLRRAGGELTRNAVSIHETQAHCTRCRLGPKAGCPAERRYTRTPPNSCARFDRGHSEATQVSTRGGCALKIRQGLYRESERGSLQRAPASDRAAANVTRNPLG